MRDFSAVHTSNSFGPTTEAFLPGLRRPNSVERLCIEVVACCSLKPAGLLPWENKCFEIAGFILMARVVNRAEALPLDCCFSPSARAGALSQI